MGSSEGDALRPTIGYEEDGDLSVLGRPKVETLVDGEAWRGEAKVRLELRPRPGIRVYCLFDEGVTEGVVAFRTESDARRVGEVVVDGRKVTGFGTKAKLLNNDVVPKMWVEWSPGEEPIAAIGDQTVVMRRVRFSLFNFVLRGLPYRDGSSSVEQIDFADANWSVRIRSLASTEEALKRKREEGGVHLTHAGDVVRTNGGDFTGTDAADVLAAVEHYLWFVEGARCELCCPVGLDAGGERVWSQWSSPGQWHEDRRSWLDRRDPENAGKLFSGFMDRWRQGHWNDALREVIYWYGLANDSGRGIDAGIASAQTALERLCYECCVREWNLMTPNEFKGKRAADLLRTLLGRQGIPAAIPAAASGLAAEAPRRNPQWVDGAQAVTEIRNILAHGGRRRSSVPAVCYIEAWALAVWFVEMAVLALCGYGGGYWDRNSESANVVPWTGTRT